MTKDAYAFPRHSCFVLISSFDIRASSFRLQNAFGYPAFVRSAKCKSIDHKTIVSPRAGPTLTMHNFAPVNLEMYLTYFLAAEGSCENFRAE